MTNGLYVHLSTDVRDYIEQAVERMAAEVKGELSQELAEQMMERRPAIIHLTYEQAVALARELPHTLEHLESGATSEHWFAITTSRRPISVRIAGARMKQTKRTWDGE